MWWVCLSSMVLNQLELNICSKSNCAPENKRKNICEWSTLRVCLCEFVYISVWARNNKSLLSLIRSLFYYRINYSALYYAIFLFGMKGFWFLIVLNSCAGWQALHIFLPIHCFKCANVFFVLFACHTFGCHKTWISTECAAMITVANANQVYQTNVG